MSLVRLHSVDEAGLRRAYAPVVPPRCWEHVARLDSALAGGAENPAAFRVIAAPGSAEVHLRVPARRRGGDYALSLDLNEAGAGQMEVGFVLTNDLTAPRFNIDVDAAGKLTLLGTAGRNLGEELRAMRAGLGPCQVRRGLGVFADLLPRLERFARPLGYVAIVLEPLTYHNAVMYERHGFAYLTGRQRMVAINAAFAPGGVLARALDGRSPFRQPAQRTSARGRSWAIHDGILTELDGDPTFDVRMVKVSGQPARQRTYFSGPASQNTG